MPFSDKAIKVVFDKKKPTLVLFSDAKPECEEAEKIF